MIAIPSIRGVANRSSMAEQLVFTTDKSSGTWGGSNTAGIFFTDAQRLVVEYTGTGWSGGTATVTYGTGTGYGSQLVYVSRGISGAGTKTITIYPTDSSGQRRGRITQFYLTRISTANNTQIVSANIKGCRNLNTVVINTSANTLTSLDVSGLKDLVTLSCNSSGGITSIDVTGCSSLETIDASDTLITNLTGLASTASTLRSLSLGGTPITSLDVSNFSVLTILSVANCASLTSLRAANVTFDNYGYSGYGNYLYTYDGGANLSNTTAMTTAAMDQFYTDLGTVGQGLIYVFGAGSVGNYSIATNKNYIVIGTLPP